MKGKGLKILLLSAVLLLLVLNAYLLHQNNYYRQQNRVLILQNDSILSVNLELKVVNGNTLNATVQTQD